MALAAILASIDGLAEAIKGEYRPATEAEGNANPALKGKFILDVTEAEGFGLDNVSGLRATIGREKGRADKAEQTAGAFTGLNLKPADVAARLQELEDLKKLDPANEADKLANAKIEAMKRDLVAAHDTEKKGLTDQIGTYRSALDANIRRGAAVKAIADAGGSVEALLPHVLGATKFVEANGKFDVQVVDQDGNPRIGDAGGNPMSLDQLVGEFKKKDSFAPLFKAEGGSGGGGRQGSGGGGAPAAKTSELDFNAKAAYISEHGSEAYLALPA